MRRAERTAPAGMVFCPANEKRRDTGEPCAWYGDPKLMADHLATAHGRRYDRG